MKHVDDRLEGAVSDLQVTLGEIEPPPFRPNRRPGPALAAIVVVLVGLGLWAFGTTSGPDNDTSVVTTQPDTQAPDTQSPDTQAPDAEPSSPGSETPGPFVAPPAEAPVSVPFDSAIDGVFTVPMPGVSAFNADGTRLLLYQTGDIDAAHVVFDIATKNAIFREFLPAPDIEQVYWSSHNPNIVHYAEEANLIALDVTTGATAVAHRFDDCDFVTAGDYPVKPSVEGPTPTSEVFGFLCVRGEARSLVSVDVATGAEVRVPTTRVSAPHPSPDGTQFAVWDEDGTVAILNADLEDTGVVHDLFDNPFVFVEDAAGATYLASVMYDGDITGTIVTYPLSGGDPRVILADYPISGVRLSGPAAGARTRIAVTPIVDEQGAAQLAIVDLGANRVDYFERTPIDKTHDHWSSSWISISPDSQTVVYGSSTPAAVTTQLLEVGS